MKYCTKCGNQLHDSAVLCPVCGCMVDGKTTKILKDKNISTTEDSKKKLITNYFVCDLLGAIALCFLILRFSLHIYYDYYLFRFLFWPGTLLLYAAFSYQIANLVFCCRANRPLKDRYAQIIKLVIYSIFAVAMLVVLIKLF